MHAGSATYEQYMITKEPYYVPQGKEIALFNSAYQNQIPVLLKGPTGCGKTRFMHYMAWKLERPLITVSCHDDLTSADLVGRYLIRGSETVWIDGPLSAAVKAGAFCYLDEIVEARKDTIVVIHPLADDRRVLPVEKKGELLKAPPEFLIALSYNPGYQSVLKDLKQSTRQRFLALEFAYPAQELEKEIVMHESGVSEHAAHSLVSLAEKTRNLKDQGLTEGASTRLLINAAKLTAAGIDARKAHRAGSPIHHSEIHPRPSSQFLPPPSGPSASADFGLPVPRPLPECCPVCAPDRRSAFAAHRRTLSACL